MSDSFLLTIFTSLWLGILTSLSPCPLTTNIAAMTFISKRIVNIKNIFIAGISYTTGRMLSYTSLAIIIIASILSIEVISNFFQTYMNKILGPILIFAGMFLLDLITFNIGGITDNERIQKLAEKNNYIGALILGVVFSLSFCPVSAALFFGSLIPLSIKYKSMFIYPSVYGVGTALPVFLIAILISLGAKHVGNVFEKLTAMERWVRKATGIIFIIVGIYYSITFIFKIHIL
ncbi:MAG: aromatic aminobenezylarsenical efflux permease ArsG family transporter [Spirochaetota bacterium]|nr:aromatic aminobenezylarsenical efflux permease ArsG family transporter [Spirochaetota bacterium]